MPFSTSCLYARLVKSLNIIKITIVSKLNIKTIINIAVISIAVIGLYSNPSRGTLLTISNIYI